MMSMFGSDAVGEDVVRQPAVAGQFYPARPEALKAEIKGYLEKAPKVAGHARLLISPHAGYVFSGPVAAKGFATVDPSTSRAILLGPSHHQYFEGVAVSGAGWYGTPLGKVRVDTDAVRKLRSSSLVVEIRAAEGPEHSLEVQLPFLQMVLQSFAIVPVLTGKVDPRAVAELLKPLIDQHTIVVASSDLSHYLDQKAARALDDATIKAILSGTQGSAIDACGEAPIRIVMHLADMLGLKPVLLDARTSFETAPQHGASTRVVGYASIVYPSLGSPAPAKVAAGAAEIDAEMKKFLLKLARASLDSAVRGAKPPAPDNPAPPARELRGCFVTLSKSGQLRGCIGYIEPIKPLYQAVIENARNAALHDPRFPAVTSDELGEIAVEVSILTKPEPLHYKDPADLLNKLVPGRDGVILQSGPYQSTYLPQVWEQLPGKLEFLEHLSMKGGMARDGWKKAQVKTYQAEHFQE